MKKKLLFTFLALFVSLCVNAAIGGTCGNGVSWSYDKETTTLTIFKTGTGTGAMTDYDMDIEPADLAPWYNEDYREDISTILILNGVTHIGNCTFAECKSLTSVTIPNSVTSIGKKAFAGCTFLESVTIPESVESIGMTAFQNCSSLASVTCLATSIPTLESDAFDDCASDLTIYVPTKSVEAYKAAEGWTADAKSIQPIPYGNCGTTGHEAEVKWVYDSSSEVLTISGIGEMVDFAGATEQPWNWCGTNFTTVVIEEGVTSIGLDAFTGCTNLTTVTIPASMTSIGEEAFYSCDNLKSVTFQGATPPKLGCGAFYLCDNITIYVLDAPTAATYKDADSWSEYKTKIQPIPTGTCGDNLTWTYYPSSYFLTISGTGAMADYNDDSNKAPWCELDGTSITSVEIKGNVTHIGHYAFNGCTNLTSITIPASVTFIGNYAFSGCPSLPSVTIPASATNIGANAFSDCTSLTTISIPKGMKSIGAQAFAGCTNLTTVTSLNRNPPVLGGEAFKNCSSLEEIKVMFGSVDDYQKATIWKDLKKDDASIIKSLDGDDCGVEGHRNSVQYSVDRESRTMYFYGSGEMESPNNSDLPAWSNYHNAVSTVVIEEGVTSIGDYAFATFEDLNSITIPETVTKIGSEAFRECSSISSITIPKKVKEIKDRAFWWCEHLPVVTCLATTPPELGTDVFKCMDDEDSYLKKIFVPKESLNSYLEKWSAYSDKFYFTFTVGECGWASMYQDLNVVVPEGATAYYASAVNGSSVTLTPITAGNIIPANTGVLINAAAGDYDFYYTSTAADPVANLFEGVTVDKLRKNDVYVLNTATSTPDSPKMNLYGGENLTAGKAYLPASAIPASAKDLTIVFDSETTGVSHVENAVNVENVGNIYDLSGRYVGNAENVGNVGNLPKGLYIINGKKYLNK